MTGKPTLFSGAYGDLTGTPTNVSTFTNDSGYLTNVPPQTFVSLSDTPPNFTGQAGKFVKVNAGETALEFDTVSGSGITDIVQDTTPQLGGALDLNNNNITGNGSINISGDATVFRKFSSRYWYGGWFNFRWHTDCVRRQHTDIIPRQY